MSETTGSAPTSDRTASVDCERETWPYLSRPCMEEMQSKPRIRVISTDKLDKSTITAIEATPPARPELETGDSGGCEYRDCFAVVVAR